MERLLSLANYRPETADLSGTYTAHLGGTECLVELWLGGEGFVSGHLSTDGDRMDIRGGFSRRTGALHGFLIEPFGAVPVALFRARLSPDGLTLEVDVPDFEELMDLCSPETLTLSKVFDDSDLRHAAD